jgi:hypothetical protein
MDYFVSSSYGAPERDDDQSAPNSAEQIPSRPSIVAPAHERGAAPEDLVAVPTAKLGRVPVPVTDSAVGVNESGVGDGPGPYVFENVPGVDEPDTDPPRADCPDAEDTSAVALGRAEGPALEKGGAGTGLPPYCETIA